MTQEAPDITLREAQEMVDRWIRTVGVRYFSPLTNMAVLAEETGEVARIMARQYGDQSPLSTSTPTLATNWPTCCGSRWPSPTRPEWT